MALKIARVTDRKTSEQYEALGIQEFAAGNLDAAAAHLFAALELDDKKASLYLKLGAVFLQQGLADKALIAIKRSLELSPYEADAYNAMGVVLYHHEFFGASEKFFRKALQLDPTHASAKSSVIDVMKRLRDGDNALPPEFDTVLALLETKEPRLSLCMIAKNEELFLGDCLASVRELVDEIILVDTGSTDRTLEIAESFGAKIFHLPWQGDFATARNESLAHATGDWILVLDADEMIPTQYHGELKQAMRDEEKVGYHLIIENLLGSKGESHQEALIFRLFRNRPDIRYEGIIHEQALPSAERTGMPLKSLTARIIHRGYLDQHVADRNKHQRNLEILLRQVEIEPTNPYVYFNLGQTYKLLDQKPDAAKAYARSLALLAEQDLPLSTAYQPHLYFSFVDLYRLMGKLDEALALADEGVAKYPAYPDIIMTKGLVLLDMKRYEEAIACFEACRQYKGVVYSGGNDPTVPTFKSSQGIGVAYSRMGEPRKAKQYFLQALAEMSRPTHEIFINLGIVLLELGELSEALSYFIRALEIDEKNAQAWSNVGYISQALGQEAEAFVARKKAFELDPAGNALVYANSLLSMQRYAEAETLFAEILEREPASSAARIFLGLAQLCTGKSRQAAETWQLLSNAPSATPAEQEDARMLQVFCGLVEGLPAAEAPPVQNQARQAELWSLALNHLLLAERYGEAEKALGALATLTQPELAFALGRVLLTQGLHGEAMTFLLKAREAMPENPAVYLALGEAAEAQGSVEDAQVMYQALLSLEPKRVDIRQRLGRLRLASSGTR